MHQGEKLHPHFCDDEQHLEHSLRGLIACTFHCEYERSFFCSFSHASLLIVDISPPHTRASIASIHLDATELHSRELSKFEEVCIRYGGFRARNGDGRRDRGGERCGMRWIVGELWAVGRGRGGVTSMSLDHGVAE